DFHVTGVQTCALPISRLGLRLARLGARRDPRALALQRLLAGGVLAALLRHALGLGLQIGAVIALVGNAAAAVELEDPARHIVEEIGRAACRESGWRGG